MRQYPATSGRAASRDRRGLEHGTDGGFVANDEDALFKPFEQPRQLGA
jgi:hypothetical protein